MLAGTRAQDFYSTPRAKGVGILAEYSQSSIHPFIQPNLNAPKQPVVISCSQEKHSGDILNLTRRTNIKDGESNSAISVLEQPLSKYIEKSGGCDHDDHGNSENGSDAIRKAGSEFKRKKPASDVNIGGHPRSAKRQTQPLQDRKSNRSEDAPSMFHGDTDDRRDAGGSDNDDMGGIVNVSGWQRPLLSQSRAAAGNGDGKSVVLPFSAVECGVDGVKGGATTRSKGSSRWVAGKDMVTSTSALADRKRNQSCREDEENFLYRDTAAFRNILTTVDVEVDVLYDGGDDDCDMAKAPVTSAFDDSLSTFGGDSSKSIGIGGEQEDCDSDGDSQHRFVDCPITSISTGVHPFPPPVDTASSTVLDTCTWNRSPKLKLWGEAINSPTLSPRPVLSRVSHNRQNQASFPPGRIWIPSSPLPLRSFHEDDIEFVTKDFGDCLLSDYQMSEARVTGTDLSFEHDTMHNNDSMFLSNSGGGSIGGKGGGIENSSAASPKTEMGNWRASIEMNSGRGTTGVRSPTALPPTPASLSLQSPVQEVAPWLRGL